MTLLLPNDFHSYQCQSPPFKRRHSYFCQCQTHRHAFADHFNGYFTFWMPIYYNIPEIGQILRVVEESDHPVDGGEGDDVDQDYHVACSDIFIDK